MKIKYEQAIQMFTLKEGNLYWSLPTKGRRKKGALAGNINGGNGCRYIEINGKNYPASHIVWLISNKVFPVSRLEHVNGNRLDDRIENLRGIVPESIKVDYELVRKIFNYVDGHLIWKEKISPRSQYKIGNIAGAIQKQKHGEYRYIKIGGRRYKAANLVWIYNNGCFPEDILDHINHIKHDDRIENLREATPKENCRNRSISKANTSGVTGVYRNNGKWVARIGDGEGGRTILGYFSNFENAVRERKHAEKMLNYHKNHGGK